MSLEGLQRRGAGALRRYLDSGDEGELLEAYEFGRTALAEGVGVLDMALLLSHLVTALPARARPAQAAIETFLIEALSPYEMAHRGGREAGEALRRIDERREELVRRIAHELHDHAGQLVAGVRLSLDALQPHVRGGGAEHFARACERLEGVADELRRLAHELRPAMLDDLGLVTALRFLAKSASGRSGVEITFAGSLEERLPAPVETAVYRTVQEALSNVIRHARASHAVIALDRDHAELRWQVSDDGRGFDPEALDRRGHRGGMGLDGIRERVTRLGGALEIRSRRGSGATLTLRVPLEVSLAHTHPAGG